MRVKFGCPLNTMPSKSYASRSGTSQPLSKALSQIQLAVLPGLALPSPLPIVSYHMKTNEHILPYVSQNPSHVALTYNQKQVLHGIAVTPSLHNIFRDLPQESAHPLTVY